MGGIFVIIGSLFFGFSNAFWKRATSDLPFFVIIFCRGLITSSIFGILWLVEFNFGFFSPYVGPLQQFNLEQLYIATSMCLLSGFGLFFFVKSMQGGVVNLVAPLSSLNIFGLLTATFVLGEPWKNSYWLPIIIMTVGLLLIFFAKATLKLNSIQKKALAYGLLSALIWGFDYTLFKIPIKWMGVIPFSFLLEFSITIFSYFIIIGYKIRIKDYVSNSKFIKNTLILSLCLLGGSMFIHLAYLSTTIAKINFFAQSQLIFTLIFGAFIYKEKMVIRQYLGIFLLLVAISLIAID
jgi:drug/metabolite transporter (DMT)-like permease